MPWSGGSVIQQNVTIQPVAWLFGLDTAVS